MTAQDEIDALRVRARRKPLRHPLVPRVGGTAVLAQKLRFHAQSFAGRRTSVAAPLPIFHPPPPPPRRPPRPAPRAPRRGARRPAPARREGSRRPRAAGERRGDPTGRSPGCPGTL